MSDLSVAEVQQATISDSNGIFTFPFKLPEDGLALRSVGIVDGVPELRFDASPKVPTISEQDVATAFRLAEENERPCFFYTPFPSINPLLQRSRFFMNYSPAWLKGTGIGELLAEADWNMKCLQVGTRTNKEKTVFKSWPKTSQLQGLATGLDFPKDGTAGRIMMSCDHARVQKSDNEICFPEEPSMKITVDSNSLYSKYITEIYRSVGYHDEPLLLKMQELIKLILAVEWLYKEKGVRVDADWMMKHMCSPKDPIKAVEFSERKEPPYDMIPRLDKFERPCSDVTVKTWEADMYKHLETECGVDRRFGYYNFTGSEIVHFNEDGTASTCIPLKSIAPEAKSSRDGDHHSHELAIPISVDSTVTDEEMKLKFVEFFKQCLSLVQPDTTGASSCDKDSNQLLQPPILGICEVIVPKVESLSEFISEWSVPIPHIWQDPFVGVGVPAAGGGVTTRDFRVEQESFQRRATSGEVRSKDNYTRNGQQLVVKARDSKITAQGTIWLDNSFQVSTFSANWKKGAPPQVCSIFAIRNQTLERKWQLYGSKLHNKQCERYYHGTSLTCDITTSQALCSDGNCGICGISSGGLDPWCIRKNIAFQRFGAGFYLAPDSSKCHDYTQGANGLRAMLLCDVYPGRKYNLENKDQKLTSPPPGYDSVYGIVGDELNYPELVVYNPDAVMPRYIVIYKKDGVAHPLAK